MHSQPRAPSLLLRTLTERAWQLAAATTASFSLAFLAALTISFFTRPTRHYFFPLLSDIDAHHPESAILRSGTFLATLLLAATTAAAASTLTPPGPPLCDSDDDDNASDVSADDDVFLSGSETFPTPVPAPGSRSRVLAKLRAKLALATRSNRRALVVLTALSVALVLTLVRSFEFHPVDVVVVDTPYDTDVLITSSVVVVAGAGAGDGNAPSAPQILGAVSGDDALPRADGAYDSPVLDQRSNDLESPAALFMLYACGMAWTCMLVFLTWYFLRIQATADDDSDAEIGDARDPEEGATLDAPPLTFTLSVSQLTLSSVSSSLISLPGNVSASFLRVREIGVEVTAAALLPKVKAWMWHCVALFRPICLTAQLVSIIKIAGLLYALHCFSIAEIPIVHIALLAALAFAEYTGAFFVSFFLLILAIDMRRAIEDDRWRSRLRLEHCAGAPVRF